MKILISDIEAWQDLAIRRGRASIREFIEPTFVPNNSELPSKEIALRVVELLFDGTDLYLEIPESHLKN